MKLLFVLFLSTIGAKVGIFAHETYFGPEARYRHSDQLQERACDSAKIGPELRSCDETTNSKLPIKNLAPAQHSSEFCRIFYGFLECMYNAYVKECGESPAKEKIKGDFDITPSLDLNDPDCQKFENFATSININLVRNISEEDSRSCSFAAYKKAGPICAGIHMSENVSPSEQCRIGLEQLECVRKVISDNCGEDDARNFIWELKKALKDKWIKNKKDQNEPECQKFLQYLTRGRVQPEHAVTQPEHGGTQPEHGGTQPNRGVTHSDRGVTQPEHSGAFGAESMFPLKLLFGLATVVAFASKIGFLQ